ncbi:MAG: ABC transporter ATP-binding protein [Aeromicrobium sp.]|uniref:ABC transporter ATP-binding protein n=1 Tax=Aeromicrobium sp. TaxID=1871063 RepID=UPI003C39AE7E
MASALELSKVSIVRGDKILLNQISWKVNEGERWIVLGPNGAGKSTLMQIAGAAIHPTQGKVKILGQRLGRVDVFDLRTRIGHVSTSIAEQIPPSESAADVIVSAAYAVTGRWQEQYDADDVERRDQIMAELGIRHLANRTFGTLSEGENKRVLIGRSLMTDPEMLLLDEPSAGLDLGAREDLLASLELLSSDPDSPVLVMVTHHVEEIPVGFTHVLLLRDGHVVAQGPLATTLTGANLARTFGTKLNLTCNGGRYTARRAAFGHRASSPASGTTGD